MLRADQNADPDRPITAPKHHPVLSDRPRLLSVLLLPLHRLRLMRPPHPKRSTIALDVVASVLNVSNVQKQALWIRNPMGLTMTEWHRPLWMSGFTHIALL
jgi:hypothetical protein